MLVEAIDFGSEARILYLVIPRTNKRCGAEVLNVYTDNHSFDLSKTLIKSVFKFYTIDSNALPTYPAQQLSLLNSFLGRSVGSLVK
jgi:hypothetical protein